MTDFGDKFENVPGQLEFEIRTAEQLIEQVLEQVQRCHAELQRDPSEIRVTELALKGSIMLADLRTLGGELKLYVHPDDWELIEAKAKEMTDSTEVTMLWGVPVVREAA